MQYLNQTSKLKYTYRYRKNNIDKFVNKYDRNGHPV